MSVNGGRGGAVTEGERVCMDGRRKRGELSLWGRGGGRGTVTMSGRRGDEFGWREGGTMREIG